MKRILLAVALAVLPVTAVAITMSNERAMAPPVSVAMGGGLPMVASDGASILAVWRDDRGLTDAVIDGPHSIRPTAARRIRSASLGYGPALLVWTGRTYLAVWMEQMTVVAAALDRDGVMIGEPKTIANASATLSLAWNGAHALLLTNSFTNSFATSRIVGQLLDSDANLVHANIVFPDLHGTADPSLIAANGFFFVVWPVTQYVQNFAPPPGQPSPAYDAKTTIFSTRVDDRGMVMEHVGVPIIETEGIGTIEMAYDGQSIAIVFMATHGSQKQRLQRFLLDPATMRVTQLPDVNAVGVMGAVVASGGGFVAAWSDNSSPSYALLTLPFTATSTSGPFRITSSHMPTSIVTAVAASDRIYLVWVDTSRGNRDTIAMTVDAGGKAATSDAFYVDYITQPELAPAIEPGLVVWSDAQPFIGDAELFASRVDANGALLDKPIQLSRGGMVFTGQSPRAIFTGSIWFVMWQEGYTSAFRTMMRRIALDGTLLDPGPVAIATSLAAAFNGTTIVVLSSAATGDLVAQRWDRYGRYLDTIPIPGTRFAYPLGMASNGNDFLFVRTTGSDWWQALPPIPHDVVAQRLSRDGTLLDPTPIVVADGSADHSVPSVASDGRDYLVSYLESTSPMTSSEWSLKVRRVSSLGFADGDATEIATGSQPTASLAGDTRGYWLVRNDSRLHVTRLDTNGKVVDDAVVATDVQGAPHIAATGTGADVAYARWDDALNAIRVFTRHLMSGAPPHCRAAAH